jgi:saccharopine dehydrogenase-like NADP-dependent oxidoreductase
MSNTQKIKEVIQDFDLVIDAVPGFMGFETFKTVIECQKNIVDIAFFSQDPLCLDALAKKNNVTAVMDCGVAPGMDNIILGYHNERMQVENFECFVGGLPQVRSFPYQYKAPFSPIDVIEEYTRDARFMVNGKIVLKPALSDPEYIEFDKIGTLEAFNTDGLRSLLFTMKIPNMKEKTLRYPGHIEYMRVLRETGFFKEEAIAVKGVSVRPIDVTAQLLFPKWKLQEEELEFTVMRILIEGKEKEKKKKYIYNLVDQYDPSTKTSSMARTTGYTCTAVAHLILENQWQKKGVFPPEFIGAEEKAFLFILNYLQSRNIRYQKEELE